MTHPPLNLCLVSPIPPPYGGIGHWTLMIRRHAAGGPDVDLRILDIAPRGRKVEDMLVVWKRVLFGGLQLLQNYFQFLRMLRSKRPDVIHINTSGQMALIRDVAILGTARRLGIPAVYHIRFGRVAEIAAAGTREWRLMRRALRLAGAVIAIDPATAQAIQQHLPGTRVVRIPNCVDMASLPAPSTQTDGVQTLIYLGWMIPAKGMDELVQAWSALRPAGWRCCILGSGRAQYARELREKHQPENLEFLGEQPHEEAMRMLAAADAFVLPSHTEGFPNVIMEAMALGKPIIATTVGAIPEMLAGGCGLLIPPRDAPALQAALRRVVSEPGLRAELGRCAREKALRCYALEAVFAQYRRLWGELAGERKPAVDGAKGPA